MNHSMNAHRNPRLRTRIVLALAAAALVSPAASSGGRSRGAGAGADDFVTGGGWIDGTPKGARANFGFRLGVDHSGNLKGHMNYVDHRERLHVRSESITSYVALDAITREIRGTANVGGDSGVGFRVTVSDAGEPGDADTFEIELEGGYTAGELLRGGNVQLHGN